MRSRSGYWLIAAASVLIIILSPFFAQNALAGGRELFIWKLKLAEHTFVMMPDDFRTSLFLRSNPGVLIPMMINHRLTPRVWIDYEWTEIDYGPRDPETFGGNVTYEIGSPPYIIVNWQPANCWPGPFITWEWTNDPYSQYRLVVENASGVNLFVQKNPGERLDSLPADQSLSQGETWAYAFNSGGTRPELRNYYLTTVYSDIKGQGLVCASIWWLDIPPPLWK